MAKTDVIARSPPYTHAVYNVRHTFVCITAVQTRTDFLWSYRLLARTAPEADEWYEWTFGLPFTLVRRCRFLRTGFAFAAVMSTHFYACGRDEKPKVSKTTNQKIMYATTVDGRDNAPVVAHRIAGILTLGISRIALTAY